MTRQTSFTENLAVEFPELARQWHPTKNGALLPSHVRSKSNKKVWWRCAINPEHEWQSSVGARHRAGCPACYEEKRLKQIDVVDGQRIQRTLSMCTDLFSELVAATDQRRRLGELYVGSTMSLAWQCKHSHPIWMNRLNKRAVQGQGCPYCAGKKICATNSLLALRPDLAKQWDGDRNMAESVKLVPGTASPGSHASVWWRCEFGHSWKAQIKQRSSLNTGCPKCRPNVSALEVRIACEVEASLGVEVVHNSKIHGIEADILLPTFKIVIEVDGYPWHSPDHRNGALERDTRKTRRLQEKGYTVLRLRERRIPVLSECLCALFDDGEAELQTCKAVMGALEAIPAVGLEVRKRSAAYLKRRSLAAEEKYVALIAKLTRPKPGESLAELFPHLLPEWCGDENRPLTPDMLKPGSAFRAAWECLECGHRWSAVVASRTAQGTGCPRCTGRVFTPGQALSDLFPSVAAEWDTNANDVGADQVTQFSNRVRAWRCAHGHTWKASVANRTKGGQSCPYCAHKRASPEWNLAVKHPDVAGLFDLERNAPLLPQDVLPMSGKSIWWSCCRGHAWRISADRQTRRGARCLYCEGTARRPQDT
ncbi:zinc-ribbon domain-containing protein [Rubrivivax sp. A210]|uniref:zinc-ribbon domain-containing protein n=1 Tax=Rubrivivax sp. A210 TaxID=2772301 RepID=UPI001919B61B|nr:zinc-ribbon domain-containing protein [Rubrivivax sp. A210]